MSDEPTCADWIDLGPLSELEEGRPTLCKVAGRRFVCVREAGVVHALDDRCPHQGYPLSQGSVVGGVLTCAWHNWKFEVASGECTFGGEPVRRYLTVIRDGRVKLDGSVDHESEAARLELGLRAALVVDDVSRALREGLRLGEHRPGDPRLGRLGAAFQVLAQDGAARAEYGFDHGVAVLTDVLSWVARGWLPAEQAFAFAAACVAERARNLGPRPLPEQVHVGSDGCGVGEALLAERRGEAESRVRALAKVRPPRDVVRDGLLPFAAEGLFDYGHGTIFLAKAEELATFFPAAAVDVLGAMAVTLGWATNETALPPFTATRKALAACDELPALGTTEDAGASGEDDVSYVDALLAGEREAVTATVARLASGATAASLLRLASRAAAVRVARFDAAWEAREDADVDVLDVTHTLTFADACSHFAGYADEAIARKLAIVVAGFIGKVRAGDAPNEPSIQPSRGGLDALVEAVVTRDASTARALAAGLPSDLRIAAYPRLAPFFAFDMAVRPILAAHGVKVAEASYRRSLDDPEHAALFLDALLAFAVPRRRERNFRRIARIATAFLADGRPPEGIY